MKQSEEITVNIDGIGLVLFKKSKKHNGISIRLKPFNLIEVLYPSKVSINKATDFVKLKKNWIIKKQAIIKSRENLLTIFDENTEFKFKTDFYELKIQKCTGDNVYIQSKQGVVTVYYPENMAVSDIGIQKTIREAYIKILRFEAKKILPDRTSLLAYVNEFNFNKISIKNLKTRWGSCSSKNNINLNLHLMRLPDYLIDYVILHELCHTKEKNHGIKFWNLLDKCTDNKAKTLSKEINNYSTFIY